jgi:hypothetical protein
VLDSLRPHPDLVRPQIETVPSGTQHAPCYCCTAFVLFQNVRTPDVAASRIAISNPKRIEALIVQNAVAHDKGLGAGWKVRRVFWRNRSANEAALRENLVSLQTTRARHVGTDPNIGRHDPDLRD